MTIIEWLDSLSDLPGHYLLKMIQRDIEGMQQLNERTSMKFIDSYRYHLPMMTSNLAPMPERYKTIRTKIHIQEWSYHGFKAVMWRIWGAILEGVPEHGYKFVERKVLDFPNAAIQTREFAMKEYGFMGWELEHPIRLVFFYDPLTDTLYTHGDFAKGWV